MNSKDTTLKQIKDNIRVFGFAELKALRVSGLVPVGLGPSSNGDAVDFPARIIAYDKKGMMVIRTDLDPEPPAYYYFYTSIIRMLIKQTAIL